MDSWDPEQYERFKGERTAPFEDLLTLVEPVAGGSVVDLGCGTGELTWRLHTHVGAFRTVGVDSSPSMLEEANTRQRGRVTFQRGDINTFGGTGEWDVVAANASLHWVPDHPAVLGRWAAALRPGGQLAVQVPANIDHPSHWVAAEVGREVCGDAAPVDPVANVLKPEQYAELLDGLGFERQHVRLQVYGHRMASSADVVEWVKGTSLTRFRSVLDDADYADFLDRYRARLLEVIGDRRPYFYAFKRILMWGRLPAVTTA